MMKRYLQQNLTVYYMHSRARRILWNLFRLLANRWRIYFTFITLSVKNPSVKSDEFLPWWQIFFTDEIFYRLIFFYRQIIFVVRSSGFKPEKKQFKKKKNFLNLLVNFRLTTVINLHLTIFYRRIIFTDELVFLFGQ